MNDTFNRVIKAALSSADRTPTEVEQLRTLLQHRLIRHSILRLSIPTMPLSDVSPRIRKLMENGSFPILHQILASGNTTGAAQLNNVLMNAILEA